MNNRLKILSKTEFINWQHVILITYLIFTSVALINNIRQFHWHFIIYLSMLSISPVINKILKYIFNKTQIIYDNYRIIQIHNAPIEMNIMIDITNLKSNNIIELNGDLNTIHKNRVYISIKYKFEPQKHIFTNNILGKQHTTLKVYYNPQTFSVQVYQNLCSTYKADISKYQHLLTGDCATSIESILIPAINDAIESVINPK